MKKVDAEEQDALLATPMDFTRKVHQTASLWISIWLGQVFRVKDSGWEAAHPNAVAIEPSSFGILATSRSSFAQEEQATGYSVSSWMLSWL